MPPLSLLGQNILRLNIHPASGGLVEIPIRDPRKVQTRMVAQIRYPDLKFVFFQFLLPESPEMFNFSRIEMARVDRLTYRRR